ncbi:MAG: apolipoprotein N-acyltransferase [Acidobacteriota bacterium]
MGRHPPSEGRAVQALDRSVTNPSRVQGLLAVASGVLLALSFPRYGHPAFVFVALAPLYVAISGWPSTTPMRGVSASRAWLLGLLAGAVHFAGTVYWTSGTVETFGGLPGIVAAGVAALLVLYLALFVAAASAASAVMIRRFGYAGLALAPAAWVSSEYLRGYLFGGFPWVPLGNAAVTLLPLAQLASIIGVYGLSWLLALLNVCVVVVATSPGRPRAMAAGAWMLILVSSALWGSARMAEGRLTREGSPLPVALVQGNVPQGEKWDPARAGVILDRYLTMTREAVGRGARLVIWPESATPFFFDEDPVRAAEMRRTVASLGTPLLFGTDEVEPGTPNRYFNSAFMLDSGGATAATYRKVHLVPFGEYVPFGSVLTFVAPLVEAVADFSPGSRVTMLPVDGHMATTAICYEVVYPHLIRQGVLQGSELLTTITNDAWYGESSAAFQHFDMAVMRAIEHGRYLARAANTGISGIVDPYGRVLGRTQLFETATVVGEVRFLRELTVYATIGDLTAQLAVLVTLLGVGLGSRRSASHRRADRPAPNG